MDAIDKTPRLYQRMQLFDVGVEPVALGIAGEDQVDVAEAGPGEPFDEAGEILVRREPADVENQALVVRESQRLARDAALARIEHRRKPRIGGFEDDADL